MEIEEQLKAVEAAGGRVWEPARRTDILRVMGPEAEVRAVAVATLGSDNFKTAGMVGRNKLGSFSADIRWIGSD